MSGPLGYSSSQHRRTPELVLQKSHASFRIMGSKAQDSGFGVEGSGLRVEGEYPRLVEPLRRVRPAHHLCKSDSSLLTTYWSESTLSLR